MSLYPIVVHILLVVVPIVLIEVSFLPEMTMAALGPTVWMFPMAMMGH